MNDNVNHPAHYTAGNIECIEAIKESMTHRAFMGYCKGNVIKYLWRYENKNNPLEDLKKARWYIDTMIRETNGKSTVSASYSYTDAGGVEAETVLL